MRLVPNGDNLKTLSRLDNAHQIALRAKASYPSVERYLNDPDSLTSMATELLASILIDGVGLEPESLLDLRIGDVFKLIES